jgi:hypothetical protein
LEALTGDIDFKPDVLKPGWTPFLAERDLQGVSRSPATNTIATVVQAKRSARDTYSHSKHLILNIDGRIG